MVNAKTSRAQGEETVKMIEQAGGKAALHIADASDPRAVAAMVEDTVRRFGRLDALVNNAAVRMERRSSRSRWRMAARDREHPGRGLRLHASVPAASHQVGRRHGDQHRRAHRASRRDGPRACHRRKGGLAGMTKALALDLAPHHITVNCVVPGTIESQRGLPGVPERPAHSRGAAAGRAARRAEESRRWCACSAVPTRANITGQAIHVTGGGYMP